tara:strand:+ start:1000 stop:1449 length:450 start_codon:yes stop_codon:yes gene_type:complete
MSDVFTSTGTLYAISAAVPATYDSAGFAALTWTDVAEVTDMGEYGATYEVVSHNPLATRRTVKRKGTVNDGALAMQLGRDPADAGQALIIAGVDGAARDTVHSHRVTLQDGTIQYVTGQLFSYTTNVGSSNQIVGAAVTVELDNAIVEV